MIIDEGYKLFLNSSYNNNNINSELKYGKANKETQIINSGQILSSEN